MLLEPGFEQPPLAPLAALHFKMRVELLPTVDVRYRNHAIASGIADQALDLALTTPRTKTCPWGPRLIVPLGRSSELIRKQIVTL
jgi:hypothetical protein